MKNFLLKIFGFLFLFFVLLEVFARLLPAADYPAADFDEQFGFDRLDKNYASDGVFTYGRLAEIKASWHINNEGWNSGIDYVAEGRNGKKLAVISGDSYINSLYCNYSDQIGTQLKQMLGDTFEVYSFGNSGTNLADYYRYASYFKKFSPDICIYMVNYGDVYSSLRKHALNTTCSQIGLEKDSLVFYTKKIVPAQSIKESLRNSKGWVYINQNFNFWSKLSSLPTMVINKLKMVKPSVPAKEQKIITDSTQYHQEIRLLVNAITQQNPAAKHIFVMHPNREAVYSDALHTTIEQREDLQVFKNAMVDIPGCSMLDLSPFFNHDYQKNKKRFEFPINHHFSGYGNFVAAKGISNFLK